MPNFGQFLDSSDINGLVPVNKAGPRQSTPKNASNLEGIDRAMNVRIDETMRVALLVDDLFRAVETNQGYFHVSGKEAVRKMEAFLRKHGELRKLGKAGSR